MADIPGLPTTGTIPRLGQGVPGGAAGLTGLPGAAGGSQIPGLPSLSAIPRLGTSRSGVSPIPGPALDTPNTAFHDSGALDHGRNRIDSALKILDEVRRGRLEPLKAAKMLDELTPTERRQLTQSVLKHNVGNGLAAQPELQALRYLPMGKSPGSSASLDPERGTGVASNLVSDAFNTVVGLPAGLGLAGVAVGKDLNAIAQRRAPTHTLNEIVKPIGKSYAQTYGPLAHGDFSGLEQHPLMPVLDAASLVSGGLGVAGRVGEAARALRAARTVEIPGEGVMKIGDRALKVPKGIKVSEMPEGKRMELLREVRDTQFAEPKAAAIAQQVLINGASGKIFVARDSRTGKLLGISHHMPGSSDPADTSMYLNGIASTGTKPGAGTALMHAIAKDTEASGKTHINLQSTHSAEGFYKQLGMEEMMPGQDAGYFSGDVTRDPTFVTKVGAPGGRVTTRQTINDLRARISPKDNKAITAIARKRKIPFDDATDLYFRGTDPEYYTVHEHAPKVHAPELRAETTHDTIHTMNEHELTTDGHPMVNPTPEELEANPWRVKHVVSTSRTGHQIHYGGEEHDELWQAMEDKGILKDGKFTDNGEMQRAMTLIHDPDTGRPVRANLGGIDSRGMTPDEVSALEAKVLADAQRRFKDPPPKPHEVDESGHTLREWDPRTLVNQEYNLGDDMVAVSAAVDKRTGKIYSSTRDHTEIMDHLPQDTTPDQFDQYTVIVDREGKVLAVNGKTSMMRDSGVAADAATQKAIKAQIERKMARAKSLPRGPTPEELKAHPYMNRFPVAIHRKTGEMHIGELGDEHIDLHEDLGHDLENPAAEYHQGTGVFDPDTGKVANVNMTALEDRERSISNLGHDDRSQSTSADYLAMRERALQAAREKFDGLKPPEAREPNSPRYSVRQKGKIVAQNFPDKESAVKHAQSLISPFAVGKSPGRAALSAFVKGGGSRGRLIDRYEEKRGYTHAAEVHNMMNEIADVLDNDKLRMNRRTVGEVAKEVLGDIRKTRLEGKSRGSQIAADNPGFFGAYPVRKGLATGETALREASDLVRAGAIYLRPAYLPNNWAGNLFMNSVHQGVLAPVNLAKSMVLDKHIGKRYTAAMDKAMGQNAAETVTAAKGRGYVGSVTNPIAHSMGMLADQPFRRAAFIHEARRAGYSKLSDVQELFDRAMGHESSASGKAALEEIAQIGRRAQEEIVKFNHFNDTERAVVRNLIFVYAWVRGSARYAARFAAQHPIQSDVFQHLSNDVGNPYLAKELGGKPSYLLGAVPVGRDKNGNPILINPFSLNPLGTAVDVARAAHGTYKVLSGDRSFNKFVDSDIANITNPLIQNYLTAREGGKKPLTQLEQTIAPVRLAHDLMHPGSGSVFPTSRTEALGHYVVGSLFPRVADQQALTRSLEREQRNDPVARIPTDVKTFKKLTGESIPDDFVQAYRDDLTKYQDMQDFQHKYADKHGQSGFRNLPAANRVDAAIKYLAQKKLATPSELAEYRREAKTMTSDADLNSLANALFGSTGIGSVKSVWDDMMSTARGSRLSRARG